MPLHYNRRVKKTLAVSLPYRQRSASRQVSAFRRVSAFRMMRHHLAERRRSNLVLVCGDVCGIQAQVMGAAQIAFAVRTQALKPASLHAALAEKRTLVKTSCMRQTLHIVPAADFHIYINALKKSRVAAVRRIMSRFGITQNDYEALNRAVVEALRAGPLTQRELTRQIMPRMNKHVRAWMAKVWSSFKAALAEGLICYGPNQGSEVSLVCVDQWLPGNRTLKNRTTTETVAQQILLRRYLSAYGPATLRDFSRWSGISMAEVKTTFETITEELMEVEGAKGWILRKDYPELINCEVEGETVRLLPSFDPFLLGHAKKDHLVDSNFYKRVYRNAGWISPVVLVDGKIAGVWTHKIRGDRTFLECEPFDSFSKAIRVQIEDEAERLAQFLGVGCDLKFHKQGALWAR